jgi:hypothetical protein
MEHTPAYHCLPLVMANLHGWEMLCPFDFEVVWSGGKELGDVTIVCAPSADRSQVVSNFGHGILSFNPSVVMRTSPGINLWVTGPINAFKDGIQAMSAYIETDWLPFTFSINWKITRPNHRLRFERGEPFCAFFPIPRGMAAACEPQRASLDDEPKLVDAIRWGTARRNLGGLLGERERDLHQLWYVKGEFPRPSAGEAPHDHETNLDLKPFRARDTPR